MDYWMAGAAVAAYFIKGLCGFANSLVFASLMSFRANTVDITPVDLVLSAPSNLLIIWKNRQSINPRTVIAPALMCVAGMLPGAFLLKMGDVKLLKLAFGGLIIALAIEMLLRDVTNRTRKGSPLVMTMVGILSGFTSGLFGIGALLSAYVSRTTDNQSAFRGTICAVFMINDIARMVVYAATGVLTYATLRQSLCLTPFMAVGLWLGMRLSGKIGERQAQFIVIEMLIASGVSLIAINL